MSRPNLPVPIVIDTDIGGDPDDAIALSLACASPEVELLGVTVVDGDVGWRAKMARTVLDLAGRPDVPVIPGISSRGPAMMGVEGRGLLDEPWDSARTEAVAGTAVPWLTEHVTRQPFHLVAIGPLTNVAAACRLDPDFAGRLLGLTVMGGVYAVDALPPTWQRAIAREGMSAWPDYNTMVDPPASLAAAQSGAKLTWITSEITHGIPVMRADRDRLAAGGPLGQALSRMIDAWYEAAFRPQMLGGDGIAELPADAVALLHDPLTVASLFPQSDDWLTREPARLRYAIDDGVFRLYPTEDAAGSDAIVSTAAAAERFASFCIERVLGLDADISGHSER